MNQFADSIQLSQRKAISTAAPLIEETVLKLLTRRHVTPNAPLLGKAVRQNATAARKRLNSVRMIGVGFGVKETNGHYSGDLAVRVYVTRKVRRSRLSRAVRVPELVAGYPTDVVAVGRFVHHQRPVAYGASISRAGGFPGSIGCLVTREGDKQRHLLSAAHVLAGDASAMRGDVIVEPAGATGNDAPLATLTDFEPLLLEGQENLMDAGIATVIRRKDVVPNIPRIGPPISAPMEATLYQSVRKFGAATGHRVGVVTDVLPHVMIDDPLSGDPILYSYVIQVTGCGGPFSSGGDSGALVVDAQTHRPVGLIIGGDGERSFVSPIERVLQRFQATIVAS